MAVPNPSAFGGATTISPGANPRSVSFDIGTPSNSKLLVGFNTIDVDDEVSSVTWNGVSMTRVGRSGASTVYDCEMWVLDAPDGGTHTLEFSYTGDGTYGGVVWWVRVDDAGAVGTLFTASGTGTSVSSGSQTCPTNGMLLVFAVHNFSTTAPTISAGTNIALTQPTNRRPVAGYRTSTGAISWTFGSSQGWNLVGVPIEEIGGGGSTITATTSLSVAIQAARSAAASAGLAIQAPHTANASASAAVQQVQAAQASLQAAVQQAQQATASVSVAAQAAGTESASLQAAIQQARAATSSLNAYLQAGSSMVADVDLAVQQGRAATASASIAARVQQALAADLSLAARQARSAAASLSMSIQGATASTVTAGLDVAVQELLTAAVGVNMALQTMRTASAALSAYLIMRRTVSAAMSTAAQAARSGTAGLSLYVQGAEVVQPLSAPPAKQRLQSSSRGANLQTSRRPLYRGGSR